jgi:histidinol-phosphatase (PHP family)
LYIKYVEEIEKVAKTGLYDVLGHPFNIRLFGHIPKDNIDNLLYRAVKALKDANMAIDINTGTKYRYPIAEISPFGRFMEIAKEYDLDIIFSSDAHHPKHCGNFIKEAAEYAKSFGFTHFVTFDKRKKTRVKID